MANYRGPVEIHERDFNLWRSKIWRFSLSQWLSHPPTFIPIDPVPKFVFMGIDQAVKRVLIEVHRVLIELNKFSTNQMQYPDLGSDTSSAWNFYARSSDVVFLGNKWWRDKMSGVFSGFLTGGCWTDRHFAPKTLRTYLSRIKRLHFSVIEQEPLITPLWGGAVTDEAVVMSPLCCTRVNDDSNQLVPVTEILLRI